MHFHWGMVSHCNANVLVTFQHTQLFLDILFNIYKRHYTALNFDYLAPYLHKHKPNRWRRAYFEKSPGNRVPDRMDCICTGPEVGKLG